jgi:hypothetical protein
LKLVAAGRSHLVATLCCNPISKYGVDLLTDFAGHIKKYAVICMLGVLGQWASAAEVPHLFRETVLVDSQSRQQRQTAAKKALAIVFVRVSGTVDVLRDDEIRSSLSRADRYLAQFGYQRHGESAATDEGAEFELLMEFQPKPVMALLRQAGQPLWSKDRPVILACIELIDGSRRQRVTAAGAGSSEWLQRWNTLVADEAQRRGLPLRLPRAAGGACAGQASSLNSDLILTGELRLVGASCVAEWTLPFEGRDHQWKLGTDSHQACVAKVVDAVAETLSARYAFAAVGGSGAPLLLQVADVGNFADYADVVLMLKSLAMVEAVDVAGVHQDTVDFSLVVQGDVDQLQQAIGMKRLLQKAPAPKPAPAPAPEPAPDPVTGIDPAGIDSAGIDSAAAPELAAPEPALPAEPAQVRLYYRLSPR